MKSTAIFSAALLLALANVAFADAPADCESERCAAQSAISQECPACGEASNHGRYVSCVAHVVKRTVSPGCRGKAIRCAARSICGKPGFVTCGIPIDTCDTTTGTCTATPTQTCTTDFDCGTRCRIKSSDTRCTAAGGQVGTATSCCASCGS